MDDSFWSAGVRVAGGFHLLTVVLAHFTPIPPGWDENLARLPAVHRRFASAQNVFIGVAMVFAGLVSLFFAREIVSGSTAARIVCAGIALWWLARLLVLPWLRVWPELRTRLLRMGFVLLHVECAAFAAVYGWLAMRPA
jgi:hypothetical protein